MCFQFVSVVMYGVFGIPVKFTTKQILERRAPSLGLLNETTPTWKNTSLFDSPYGRAAVRELTNGTAEKAMKRLCKTLKKTEDELKRLFHKDDKLRLDTYWHRRLNRSIEVFYVEDKPTHSRKSGRLSQIAEIETSFALRAQTVDVFALHSRPNASKVIYLDFDGLNITGTAWNDRFPVIFAPPFDTDKQPGTFSPSERAIILQVTRSNYKLQLPVFERKPILSERLTCMRRAATDTVGFPSGVAAGGRGLRPLRDRRDHAVPGQRGLPRPLLPVRRPLRHPRPHLPCRQCHQPKRRRRVLRGPLLRSRCGRALPPPCASATAPHRRRSIADAHLSAGIQTHGGPALTAASAAAAAAAAAAAELRPQGASTTWSSPSPTRSATTPSTSATSRATRAGTPSACTTTARSTPPTSSASPPRPAAGRPSWAWVRP